MNSNDSIKQRWLIVLLLVVAAVLAWAVFSVPATSLGQQQNVAAQLDRTGVTHPVTAVLLNFRGYDTFLEIGVLFLILVSVWSLGSADSKPMHSLEHSPVLTETARVLIPILIVVAGYLLWIGASSPGGAFQAGAILGAAGVLLTLAGRMPSAGSQRIAKVSFVIGLLVFAAVGVGTLVGEGAFLQYPVAWASSLILIIEAAATVTIGATLAALFIGGKPAVWHIASSRETSEK